MELIYTRDYPVETTDLNMYGKMRPARLLELIQQVSGLHAEILGLGAEILGKDNLSWVVVREKLEITRMPVQDDVLHFVTWPGKGMHGLFPRYMEILDQDGRSLVRSCFLWVIMNKTSRVMIQPGSYGLDMPIPEKEPLMPLPRLPKKLLPEIRKAVFTVPYSFIDVVGHMNNTRYVEISENHLEAARLGKEPRDMVIEFTHELRLDESMELEIGQEGDQYSVQGTRNGGPVFTLFIRYEE